ncbi:zinc finger protein 518B [Eleutherodactylus coqui]|uniref:zinc finger protein 518B n=1 Tax=Eleutherodactylus coqui TaxID=57060 RepID=UPI0034629566
MMNSMLQKQMLAKFNCEKCRFSTKDPNKYRNHVSLHNDIKYACSHCDFVSYTKTEFQRHLVTHTGKFPYTCGYCGYGAIRNDYIVKHIRRIHGDGKIQCSVSTLENESKKASINITQTQLTAPNILQNSALSEDIIDLTTEMDSIGSSSNVFPPNGNNIAGRVEVEVISPVDRQLYPWIPLTVVAPSSFRVPPNCIAQVVEVKPVNSACHLVLNCLNVVESTLPNQPINSEHIYEQKPLKPDISSKNITENSDGPSLRDCAVLHDDCQTNMLYPSNTLCGPEDDLHTNVKCPIDNTNEITNAVNDDANEITNAVNDDANEIMNAVNDDANEITNAVNEDANEITNAVNEDANEITNAVNEDANEITNAVNDDANEIANAVNDDANEIANAVNDDANEIANAVNDDANEITNAVNDDANEITNAVNDDANEITNAVDDANEITNAVNDDSNIMVDDLEEFSGGPIISAVFSLSSDSQNTIEGIQWDCPFSSPKTSQSNDDVDAPHSSLNPPASQEEPTVCDSELNMQMDIDKSQDVLKSSVLESENNMEKVKECIDPEIQLSTTLEPTDVKKSESQPCVPQKSRKGGRISDRLGKLETNNFSKPQTLFLSYDKRIVMQPLSCTMQSYNTMTSQVDKVTEQLQFPVKMRKESAKAKVKRLAAPALKIRYQPNMRTLRLHPFKVDQMAHTPCYNQPVVVLNHPDVESIEISNIMKAIRVFEGKIIKISLSKQMCKYV